MTHTVRTYNFLTGIAAALLATVLVLPSASAAPADVALYFSDRETAIAQDCTATLVMRRSYGIEQIQAETLLLELLSGPTAKERLAGAADSFELLAGGENSASRLVKYLLRTELKNGLFSIYFSQPALAWFNNGSCGAATVLSPIQATLLQLDRVNNVQIYIEGDRLQSLMENTW